MDVISFFQHDFLRTALYTGILGVLSATPLGVLLVVRRLSLIGDALSHSLLPGVALAYWMFGLSMTAMALGGFLAGLIAVVFSLWVQKQGSVSEDSSFASLYILSVAFGVLLISAQGSSVDLLHILFGQFLTAGDEGLYLMGVITLITVPTLFFFFRFYFSAEILDPQFLKVGGLSPLFIQSLFFILVLLNLVGLFLTTGTLLAMGQMILPAITARLLVSTLFAMVAMSLLIGSLGISLGLILSYLTNWPAGPSVIAALGAFYLLALLFSPRQGLIFNALNLRHYKD